MNKSISILDKKYKEWVKRNIHYCKQFYLLYSSALETLPKLGQNLPKKESSSQPIGISEYDLERFYPEKIEGTMPTIEELESSLDDE